MAEDTGYRKSEVKIEYNDGEIKKTNYPEFKYDCLGEGQETLAEMVKKVRYSNVDAELAIEWIPPIRTSSFVDCTDIILNRYPSKKMAMKFDECGMNISMNKEYIKYLELNDCSCEGSRVENCRIGKLKISGDISLAERPEFIECEIKELTVDLKHVYGEGREVKSLLINCNIDKMIVENEIPNMMNVYVKHMVFKSPENVRYKNFGLYHTVSGEYKAVQLAKEMEPELEEELTNQFKKELSSKGQEVIVIKDSSRLDRVLSRAEAVGNDIRVIVIGE